MFLLSVMARMQRISAPVAITCKTRVGTLQRLNPTTQDLVRFVVFVVGQRIVIEVTSAPAPARLSSLKGFLPLYPDSRSFEAACGCTRIKEHLEGYVVI